ncbi:hypothetical protein [Neorhizobium sp. DT-125]|uniref:hypothetical protein n=1 Tax=Neorhizobium sp. DT-125 TaxID=3396163 RepID=UPI003F193F96
MVRQLFKIGLEAADKADTVEEQKLRLLNIKRRSAREIVGVKARLQSAETDSERVRILERGLEVLSDLVMELVLATTDITTTTTRVFAPAIVRRSNPDIDTALYETRWTSSADEVGEESEQTIKDRLKGIQSLSNQQAQIRENDDD